MTTLTCAYKTTAVGSLSPAVLAVRLSTPPPDLTLPLVYGLRLTGDTTAIAGSTVTRTMTFSGTPTNPAAFTVQLDPGNRGSPIDPATITPVQSGSGYAAPPVVFVESSDDPMPLPARVVTQMGLTDVLVIAGGGGYDVDTTTLVISGGQLAPGGVQGTAVPHYIDGVLTQVQVLTPGGPYNVPPTMKLVDTASGAGAIISAGLGVTALLPISIGKGYATPPSFSFHPIFDELFPVNKHRALTNFMTQILEQAVNGNVIALPVAVS